jgi:hypothetical protein
MILIFAFNTLVYTFSGKYLMEDPTGYCRLSIHDPVQQGWPWETRNSDCSRTGDEGIGGNPYPHYHRRSVLRSGK